MPTRHSAVLNAFFACALLAGAVLPATFPIFAANPPRAPQPPILPPQPQDVPLDTPKAPARPVARVPNPASLDDQDITAALNKGAAFLLDKLTKDIATLKKQLAPNPNKNGPARGMMFYNNDQLAGEISMSIYALLTIGHVTGDPRFHFSSKEMQEPVKFLVELHTQFTYGVAFHASALALLPNRPEFRKPLTFDLDELLFGQIGGCYTYHTTEAKSVAGQSFGDNSNTQYGELGVWTCQDVGLEVPLGYWENVDQHWRSTQQATGGWTYSTGRVNYPGMKNNDPSSPTMTCAGVASLFLAQDELDYAVNYNPNPDRSIEAGLKWLTVQYPTFTKVTFNNYYLDYALERVALYGGIKAFGPHDWYREGATTIINAQKPDGSWGYSTSDAAYALLFLSRGLAPISVAKLQYNGPWNARSRDSARFNHWLAKQTERPLNWQTVSIANDPVQWQNIPVLVITGHDDPKFTPDQLAKLKRYVQNGGLIFSSADEGNSAFTKAIRQKYAPALFDNTYEMRPLPEDHPVFTLNYQVPKAKQPKLFGLSNGVREVWIHSADDITGSWQSLSVAKTQNFETPANIYFYTMGHTPLEIHYDPLTPPPPPPATTTLNIARIVYNGNWDPEPAAWEHFIANARQYHAAIIHAIPTKIADLDPAKTPVAHITGTTAFTLNHDDQAKLADYLAKGGTLLADSTGGNDPFAASFKAAIDILFPKDPLTDLVPASLVITGNFVGGAPIDRLSDRPFADIPQNRTKPLMLMEVHQNGKPIIIFSPGDLTAGILDLKTWGIRGYSPDDADALTWNSLMYLTTTLTPNPPLGAAAANPAPPAIAPVATDPAPPATDPALPPAPPTTQ